MYILSISCLIQRFSATSNVRPQNIFNVIDFFQVYTPLLSFSQQRDSGKRQSKTHHSVADDTLTNAVDMDDGQDRPSSSSSNADSESHLNSLLRDEFVISMHKFASGIKRTMQHIEGEVRLDVPELEWLSDDPDVNMRNDDLRRRVEETCLNWRQLISTALEQLQKKTPQVEMTFIIRAYGR